MAVSARSSQQRPIRARRRMATLSRPDILTLLERLNFRLINDSPQQIIAQCARTRSDISPTVSTVVVTTGRASLIECLESVCGYDYPSFEVTLIHDKGSNVSSARNLGIRSSKGNLIHFIDDDAIPGADNLSKLVRTWLNISTSDPKVGGLQGNIDGTAWQTRNMITRISLDFTGIKIASLCGQGITDHVCTCNSLFSASVLRAVNGFDETFDYRFEDVDLSFRIRDAGYNIYATQEGYVLHLMESRKDISHLLRVMRHARAYTVKNSVLLYYRWTRTPTFLSYVFRVLASRSIRLLLNLMVMNEFGLRRNLIEILSVMVGLRELPKVHDTRRARVS